MKQLTCEMCGSTELLKQDGVFVCQTCGTKYSVEEAKKMMIEGTVEVQVNQTENLKALQKRAADFIEEGRFEEAITYSERMLDIEPENARAHFINLMAKNSISKVSDWSRVCISKNDPTLQKVLKYADDELRELVQKCYSMTASPFIVRNGELCQYINTGYDTRIVIPSTVTAIRADVFYGCANLQEVILSDSVRVIGDRAFYECENLEALVLPNSVTRIGVSAFSCCRSLKKIVIPDSVLRIEEFAFFGCISATELTIGNKVNFIGKYAFHGGAFTNVIVPKSVFTIENNAFSYSENLETVTIEGRHTLVSKDVFENCKKLKTITRGGKNADYLQKSNSKSSGGCYVATCVYGSYDCPEVWTLRRYRDDTLGSTWYGRLFIRTYYAISPTLVKWFGETRWFKRMWRGKLDRTVARLQKKGVESTPYEDKNW